MRENVFEKNGILLKIMEFFPEKIACAVRDELWRRGKAPLEIRLRAAGQSSMVFDTGTVVLPVRLKESDVGEILAALTGGALYAHRDTLVEGYVIPFSGLRVGVCARVRYDGGRAVGVSEVRSLIFRISRPASDTGDGIFELWRSFGRCGMLIFAPPLGGKTTAIRRLAARIGASGVRVAVVDERCEFLPEEYANSEVDILRGYKKSAGIEIAVRTLGAGAVVVDEIGAAEAKEVLSTLSLGIPLIATAHAERVEEILSRPVFEPFLRSGVFECAVGIKRQGSKFELMPSRLFADGKVKIS